MNQVFKILIGSAGSCISGLLIGSRITDAYAVAHHLDPDDLIIGAVLGGSWVGIWAIGSIFFAWLFYRKGNKDAA
jgi:hypothetical protein